jgi:ferrous iron transport protein B
MMDEAESKGYKIDLKTISKEMGVPVIPMVANRNKGTDELLEEIVKVAEGKTEASGVKIEYGREVENQISQMEEAIAESPLASRYSPKWLAVKLIEGDEEVIKKFEEVKSVW